MIVEASAPVGSRERLALCRTLGINAGAFTASVRPKRARRGAGPGSSSDGGSDDDAAVPVPPASLVVWNTGAADFMVNGVQGRGHNRGGAAKFAYCAEHFGDDQVRRSGKGGRGGVRLKRGAVCDIPIATTKARVKENERIRVLALLQGGARERDDNKCVPLAFSVDGMVARKFESVAATCAGPHSVRGYESVASRNSDGDMIVQVNKTGPSSSFGLQLVRDMDFSSMNTVRITALAAKSVHLLVELQDAAGASTTQGKSMHLVKSTKTTFDFVVVDGGGGPTSFQSSSVRNMVMQVNPGKEQPWSGDIVFSTIEQRDSRMKHSLMRHGSAWWPQPARSDLILTVFGILEQLSEQFEGVVRSAIDMALREEGSKFGAHAQDVCLASLRAVVLPLLVMLVGSQLAAASNQSHRRRQQQRKELKDKINNSGILDTIGIKDSGFLFLSDKDILNERINTVSPTFGTGMRGDERLLIVRNNEHTDQPVVPRPAQPPHSATPHWRVQSTHTRVALTRVRGLHRALAHAMESHPPRPVCCWQATSRDFKKSLELHLSLSSVQLGHVLREGHLYGVARLPAEVSVYCGADAMSWGRKGRGGGKMGPVSLNRVLAVMTGIHPDVQGVNVVLPILTPVAPPAFAVFLFVVSSSLLRRGIILWMMNFMLGRRVSRDVLLRAVPRATTRGSSARQTAARR